MRVRAALASFATLAAFAAGAGSRPAFAAVDTPPLAAYAPGAPAPSPAIEPDAAAAGTAPGFTLAATEAPSPTDATEGALAFSLRRHRTPRPAAAKAPEPVLGSERARILLRSLTLPGWGQATLGHGTAARVFGIAELGVWTTFTSFRIQEQMRTGSYEHTARYLAGIDLGGRDEEFRRIVGSYLSSDDYNLYVVARDAANLYYDQPQKMRDYIDAHALRGRDAWKWDDVNALLRYRGQRKNAQRAALRANTALALAIANRLVSALHAARAAGQPARAHAHNWNLEIAPVGGNDATAFQLGVCTRF